ncbi:MAG: phosphoribosyltransferase family protein, partial [Syntrophomonadaceae bacterium]|nr:phosphoribosyltransferase family protein [Syntrophomonadaceae bacterium]
DVLIIDDIVDTGLTLSHLTELFKLRGARSVKVGCLLDKPERRKVEVPIDYCGFTVPNEFVVGYGLDYNNNYRSYPAVCVLKPEVYQGEKDA